MGTTARGEGTVRRTRASRLSLLFLVVTVCGAAQSSAQDAPVPATLRPSQNAGAAEEETGRGERVARFLLGAAAGLGLHEGSHLVFDAAFDVRPTLKKVDFAGIPFFAITHPAGLPRREEFTISSAGFWMQHASSEIVLTRHPRLRHERAPTLKGLLAFNVLASVAYASAAMVKAGPVERDTRAMAASLGVNEPWVGALVLVPAGLDAWRYLRPEARWARWLSRGVKVGSVLLVIR